MIPVRKLPINFERKINLNKSKNEITRSFIKLE